MPEIGIIRGYGEGFVTTGYIIKIIKALRRRFRSKIQFKEIPLGNGLKYDTDLDDDIISDMRKFDAIFAGDMESKSNPIDYGIEDIALSLGNLVEYVCIAGLDEHDSIDIEIASYFDGGFKLRDGIRTVDGATETRVCSTYSAMNIVKFVSQRCEDRRRILTFIKDGDNEYCADLFCSKFESFTLPLSNFKMFKTTVSEVTEEIIYNPTQFDTVFASKTFAEFAAGLYKAMLNDQCVTYRKYAYSKSVYSVKSHWDNGECGNSIPCINSYITAFADLLCDEFNMQKEACALRRALNNTNKKGVSSYNGDEFIKCFVKELDAPIRTKYSKNPTPKRYVIK